MQRFEIITKNRPSKYSNRSNARDYTPINQASRSNCNRVFDKNKSEQPLLQKQRRHDLALKVVALLLLASDL